MFTAILIGYAIGGLATIACALKMYGQPANGVDWFGFIAAFILWPFAVLQMISDKANYF